MPRLGERIRRLEAEVITLGLASLPRVPWYAKLLAGCIVEYALSPIDRIPDFIPVLGPLDDLEISRLGIALALRLIPSDVMADYRERAASAVITGVPACLRPAPASPPGWNSLRLASLLLERPCTAERWPSCSRA